MLKDEPPTLDLNDTPSLKEVVDFLVFHKKYLTPALLQRISREVVPLPDSVPPPGALSAEFDLLEEVNSQVNLVQTIRDAVIDPNTNVLRGSIRDAKDVLASSTQLLTLLSKLKAQLLNDDRMRKIEQATVETIKELPEEAQDQFFSSLEKKLEQ